jgi:hypothetical protein
VNDHQSKQSQLEMKARNIGAAGVQRRHQPNNVSTRSAASFSGHGATPSVAPLIQDWFQATELVAVPVLQRTASGSALPPRHPRNKRWSYNTNLAGHQV